MKINKLHLITIDHPSFTHVEQAKMACEAGAEWLQLRVKDKHYEEWLETAQKVKSITDFYGCQLIINDSVQIAMEVDAAGVHLGKGDMFIHSARMLLGRDKIIGGTANTVEDAVFVRNSGANYIGLGPYTHTETKKKLSPVLGLNGYRKVLQALRKKDINIPVIAIGGIQPEDVRPILSTGVFGVAVASAVFNAASIPAVLHELETAIDSADKEILKYATTENS